MREKNFFVSLKTESSDALAYKISLIVEELQARTKRKRPEIGKYNAAIDKPSKRKISKEEINEKIKGWALNKDLKIARCLAIMKQYSWNLTIKQWEKIMGEQLLIQNPHLFLISLTKEPYERSWINSKGEKRKASDYGNVLLIQNRYVTLNTTYEKIIKIYW